MKVRKLLFKDNFQEASGGTPAKWTNAQGITVIEAPGSPVVERYGKVQNVDASTDGRMTITTPPAQDAIRTFLFRMRELTGDALQTYGLFRFFFFANGVDPRAGAFTGYVLEQDMGSLQLKRYNAGTPTLITNQGWSAAHGQELYYEVYFNPSGGLFKLKRGSVWAGKYENTWSGTDGSPLASGTQIGLMADRDAVVHKFGVDDFRVLGPSDNYFSAVKYRLPMHDGSGELEFVTANDASAVFNRWAENDELELLVEREDGVSFVEFQGIVEKVEDRSQEGESVHVWARDFLSEGLRTSVPDSYTGVGLSTVIENLIGSGYTQLAKYSVKTVGTAITRTFKGRPTLDAVEGLALESLIYSRVNRRREWMIDDWFQVAGECLPLRQAALALSNLKGYWPLDDIGGLRAVDFSGLGNHGTLKGAGEPSTYASGQYRRALNFDGSNDYLNLAFSQSFTSCSILVAMKTTTDGRGILQLQDPGTSGDPLIYLEVGATTTGGNAHQLVAYLRNVGATSTVIPFNSGFTIDDGVDHLLGLTWDGSTAKLYVDGSEKASVGFTGTVTITSGSRIARVGDLVGGGYAFAGPMNNLAILTGTALSGPQMLSFYETWRYGIMADQAGGKLYGARAQRDLSAMFNKVTVYGAAGVSGSSSDAGSIATYGTREFVQVDERLGVNADATRVADGLKAIMLGVVKEALFYAADFHELYPGELFHLKASTGGLDDELVCTEKSLEWPPPKGQPPGFFFRGIPATTKFRPPAESPKLLLRGLKQADKKRWRVMG